VKITQNVEEQRRCTEEVFAWLSACHHKIEARQLLQPDPFYERNAGLTPAVVKDVLEAIEQTHLFEFGKYPEYHRAAQGVSAGEHLVPPAYLLLPYGQQLAIVQGVDRIFQRYRAEDSPIV
jgi:hypothetical protein